MRTRFWMLLLICGSCHDSCMQGNITTGPRRMLERRSTHILLNKTRRSKHRGSMLAIKQLP
ncbi:MAG: hypothetical protein JWP44_4423 [Mucilaginibacter sp.]|nr:hypothetical protein [Mucilaginibacter sp.]